MTAKVLVTGLGVISPVGVTVETFWASILAGKANFTESPAVPGSGILAGAIEQDVAEIAGVLHHDRRSEEHTSELQSH